MATHRFYQGTVMEYLTNNIESSTSPEFGSVIHAQRPSERSVVIHSIDEIPPQHELTGNVVLLCDATQLTLTVMGNLTLKGSVIASNIICLGHLSLQAACTTSTLYARGNISAMVVRECDLFAEQSIIVQRQSTESHLQAASGIHAAHAVIHGGCISAYDRVEVRKVLQAHHDATRIRVGDVFLRRRKEVILRKRMLSAEHDACIKQEVAEVHRAAMDDADPASLGRVSLLRVEKELQERLLTAAIARTQYEDFCRDEHYQLGGVVRVHGCIESGVEVHIGSESYRVATPMAEVEYYVNASSQLSIRPLQDEEGE